MRELSYYRQIGFRVNTSGHLLLRASGVNKTLQLLHASWLKLLFDVEVGMKHLSANVNGAGQQLHIPHPHLETQLVQLR